MKRIEIWEPRYHDMTVLIKASRLTDGEDAHIEITKNKYAGNYLLPGDVIKDCVVEHKEYGDMTVVPFNKLIKEE